MCAPESRVLDPCGVLEFVEAFSAIMCFRI